MFSSRLTGDPVVDLHHLCQRHGSPGQQPKYTYKGPNYIKLTAQVRFLGHEVDLWNEKKRYENKDAARKAVAAKALKMFSRYYEPQGPPVPNPRTVARRVKRRVAAATKALDSLVLSMSTPSTPLTPPTSSTPSQQLPLPNAPVSITTSKAKTKKVQPTKGKGHKKEMERMAKEFSAMQVDENEPKA